MPSDYAQYYASIIHKALTIQVVIMFVCLFVCLSVPSLVRQIELTRHYTSKVFISPKRSLYQRLACFSLSHSQGGIIKFLQQ